LDFTASSTEEGDGLFLAAVVELFAVGGGGDGGGEVDAGDVLEGTGGEVQAGQLAFAREWESSDGVGAGWRDSSCRLMHTYVWRKLSVCDMMIDRWRWRCRYMASKQENRKETNTYAHKQKERDKQK
jgi:hypothetical protein